MSREQRSGFDLANMVMLQEKRVMLQAIIMLLGMGNLFQAFIYNMDWGAWTGAYIAFVACVTVGGVLGLKVPQ